MGSEQPLLAWRSHTESNIWIGNLQTQIIRSQLFCWLLQSGTVATRDILSKNTGYILSSGVKINSHCCTALTARVGYAHPRTSLREWMRDSFIRVQILQRPLLLETLSTGHHSWGTEMRTRYSRCLGLLGIVRSVSDHRERNSKMSYRTGRNSKD
jgi:hypothetical protein